MATSNAPLHSGTLESTIWPLPIKDFMTDYWQRKPLFVEGESSRVAQLIDMLNGLDLEQLLNRSTVYTVKPGNSPHWLHGLAPAQALRLHAAGATLQIRGIEGDIGQVSRRMASDLEIPPGAPIDSGLYASRSGGLAPHWDQNDNFTIQIAGAKEWKTTADCAVESPLREGFEELTPFTSRVVELPRRWTTCLLRPGCMLYVPRGQWHSTRTIEPSISLDILVPPVPWLDVISRQLKAHLARDPEWRASSFPGTSERAPQMWKRLEHEVSYINRTSLHAPAPIDRSGLRMSGRLRKTLCGACNIRIGDPEHPGTEEPQMASVELVSQAGSDTFEVSMDQVEVCVWLVRQTGAFTFEQVVAAHSSVDRASLERLTRAFLEAGVLSCE